MRLFAEQGFTDTSVSEVQAACGLSAGSGALYKHFASKESLLEAGIERELEHLEGVRMTRRLLPDVGDFRTELEILGRFILIELAAERDFLRVLLKEGSRFPRILKRAQDRLLRPLYAEFTAWIRDKTSGGVASISDVEATAAVALGAIIQYRAIEALLGGPPGGLDEERFLQAWVEMVAGPSEGKS